MLCRTRRRPRSLLRTCASRRRSTGTAAVRSLRARGRRSRGSIDGVSSWPWDVPGLMRSRSAPKNSMRRSSVSLRRVVNASPIIFLHRVGLLEQLSERGVTVLVPDAVLEELGGLRSDDPAAVAVRSAPWVQVVATHREVTPWRHAPFGGVGPSRPRPCRRVSTLRPRSGMLPPYNSAGAVSIRPGRSVVWRSLLDRTHGRKHPLSAWRSSIHELDKQFPRPGPVGHG
jgi:hypothetical protein